MADMRRNAHKESLRTDQVKNLAILHGLVRATGNVLRASGFCNFEFQKSVQLFRGIFPIIVQG